MKKFQSIVFALTAILVFAGYGLLVHAAAPSGGYTAGVTLDPDCVPGDTDCIINPSTLTGGWTADPVGGPLGTGLSVTDYIVGIGTDDPQDLLHLYRDDLDMSVGMRIENQNPGIDSAAVLSLYNDLGLNGGLVSYSSNFSNPLYAGSFGLIADTDATGIRIFDADDTSGAGNIQFGIGNVSVMQIRDYHVNIGIIPESFLDDSSHGILNVGFTDGRNYAIFGTSTDTQWDADEETKYIFAEDYLRMGSIDNDNWDAGNRGDRSVAIGFAAPDLGPGFRGPLADGIASIALGTQTTSSGIGSLAAGFGTTATGNGSTALGTLSSALEDSAFAAGDNTTASGYGASSLGNNTTASGYGSFVAGSQSVASGFVSFAFGNGVEASSSYEIAMGRDTTLYTPISATTWDSIDRLFTIGNGTGTGSESDAFTILKSGLTGIGYDNFETTPNNALLQVNGSILQTNAVGCDVVADADGVIGCAPSDEKLKDNIEDISYGLDTVLSLRPVTYNFKDERFGTGTQVGFIAQELEGILPEVVTSGPNYKSVNYGLITPILTKAIQELDIKISDIQSLADENNSFGYILRNWFASATNGIHKLFVGEVESDKVKTNELCLDDLCITRDQLQAILNQGNVVSAPAQDSAPSETPLGDLGTQGNSEVSPELTSLPEPEVITPTETPEPAPSPDSAPEVPVE